MQTQELRAFYPEFQVLLDRRRNQASERMRAFCNFIGRAADENAIQSYELTEISAALARIREGTYGVCEKCSGSIALSQLRERPSETFCLSCSSI